MGQQIVKIDDLKKTLFNDYMTQVTNFFKGDKQSAMRFMSHIMYAVQKNPTLLECTPTSIIQSFMACAEYGLMPSSVSGECYIIPYKNSKKQPNGEFIDVYEAQFQLGYQGLVTLFYKAGIKSIVAKIVRENDNAIEENGMIKHTVDLGKSAKDRGPAIGAYVVIETQNGGTLYSYMHRDDIVAHGKRFSKSFNSKYSPWNEANDPELWMWKKTVLKQSAKLVPKNETIYKAIALDNQDSVIYDRLEAAKDETEKLTIGALTKPINSDDNDQEKAQPEGQN